MTTLEFYRGDDGAPRAQGENINILAQFLESDIQDDPDTCTELLQRLKDQASNPVKPLDFIGNSFTLSFSGKEVIFSCHATKNATTTHLRLGTVQRALQDWQEFID